METIYKYKLDIQVDQNIFVPEGGELLQVMMQDHNLCAWFKVDPRNPVKPRYFTIVGTGNSISYPGGSLHHVGSVMDGPHVWHVFERKNIEV